MPSRCSRGSRRQIDRRHRTAADRECRHRHREWPVQGNRSASGEVSVPPDAQVVDVAGKTVLPGFIDGHGHLEDFHGELYLHLGITTCAHILMQDGPWARAQKEGTELGKIRGPRIWMTGRAIGGAREEHRCFRRQAARDNIVVTTPDEARRAVRRKKELGCDLIKLNEFLSFDLVKAPSTRRIGSACR